MKRTMLALTIVLLGGLFAMWFVDSNEADLAAAAFHSSVSATPTQNIEATAQPDKPSVLLVQGGKTPVPGRPIVPQAPPRPVLLPKFPAEAALPADLLQSQKLSATPSPLQSFPNTFEGRMGKLNLFSRTNALPPPRSAPPEMQLFGRMMAPPSTPPQSTPTITQLRGYLLAEPGGREILEEAKRRGFLRLSRRSPDDESSSFSLARFLRPAEAQAAEAFKVVFTPREPKNSYLTFVGIWLWEAYKPVLDAGIRVLVSPFGSTWASFNVTVPREGMYYVNVVAYMSNVKATLVTANTIVRQFDYGPNNHTYNHWGYALLAAGSHTFYFYVDRGTAQFNEVSVQEDL